MERDELTDDEMVVVKTSRTPEELRDRLQAWLRDTTDDPTATIGPVSSPESNGMSSESLFFDAEWAGRSGSFVARVAPAASDVPVFRTYDLEKQHRLIALVAEHSDVPVPELRWLETDTAHLDQPFFVMAKVDGRVPPDIPPYAIGGWVRELADDDRIALQRASVEVLAGIHGIDITDGKAAFLEPDPALGDTPLQRHFAAERAYYEWTCAGAGRRFPTIERAFDWIEANWPTDEPAAAISWGDSRIGNIMYAPDGVDPVAVLDWEMATIAPPALDVGWMCFLHRFFEYLMAKYEMPTLTSMLRPEDVRAQYREAGGTDVGDLRFEMAYSAMRHATIMSRIHDRNVHFGTHEWPDDPDEAFLFKDLLLELISE
ncbi:MAG: phosphotransferase family protein [Actinomycetota bacterium]